MASSRRILIPANLVILTLLAITGQTILLFNVIWATALGLLSGQTTIPITVSNTAILLTFGLVTPMYCVVTSAIFLVRIRLSPFVIHTGTFTVFMLLTMDAMFRTLFNQAIRLPPYHVVQNLAQVALSFFLPLSMLGLFQMAVVNWVLGMLPPDKPLDQKTYSVNAEESSVIHVIENSSLDGLRKMGTNAYEIRRRGAKFVVLTITKRDERGTFVSTVPYQQTVSSVTRTLETSELARSVMNDVEKRLSDYMKENKKKGTIRFDEMKNLDDEMSRRALEVALKPHQSKLTSLSGSWNEIPRYHRFAAMVAFAMLIVTGGLYWVRILTDINTVASVAVLVGLVLLMELGLPLREELGRRREVKGSST